MEQTYHELENDFCDMRKSLLAETQASERLRNELNEEKKKRDEVTVWVHTVLVIHRMNWKAFETNSLDLETQ